MAAEARTTPRRRVDLLQWEHDHGRISHLALAAGRGLEEAFALLHRSGGSTWGERVDASRVGDAAAAGAVEAARRVERVMERIERIVGPVDARLLRRLLGEGHDYAGAAALDGRGGERAKAYLAQRFRDALEELGAATKAVGPRPPKVNDKYSAASEARSAYDA